MTDYKELRKQWPKGDINEVCHAVAEIYNNAIEQGIHVKAAMSTSFGVSTATAGRMIAKARELGILKTVNVGGRPSTGKNMWSIKRIAKTAPDSKSFIADCVDGLDANRIVEMFLHKPASGGLLIKGVQVTVNNMATTSLSPQDMRDIPYGLLLAKADIEINENYDRLPCGVEDDF